MPAYRIGLHPRVAAHVHAARAAAAIVRARDAAARAHDPLRRYLRRSRARQIRAHRSPAARAVRSCEQLATPATAPSPQHEPQEPTATHARLDDEPATLLTTDDDTEIRARPDDPRPAPRLAVPTLPGPDDTSRHRRLDWATLMKRAHAVDVLLPTMRAIHEVDLAHRG